MKALFLSLLIALVGFGCTPKEPIEEITKPSGEFRDGQEYKVSSDGVVKIKFNPDYIPAGTIALEIIYDNNYLGYYQVSDSIFLPKRLGEVSLVVRFMDSKDTLITSRRYTLKF